MLREYVAWARASFQPVMSSVAERLLSAYFQLRRSREGRQAARTSVRMLESLVRVAQAHARLMARNKVNEMLHGGFNGIAWPSIACLLP
jgi:DNA helicase MCM9